MSAINLISAGSLTESYPGTYSFAGETGKSGTNISVVDIDDCDGNSYLEVESTKDNHTDVLRLFDLGNSEASQFSGHFSTPQSGALQTVEAWVHPHTSSGFIVFAIFDQNGDITTQTRFRNANPNEIQFHDMVTGWHNCGAFAAQWYHVRFDMNVAGLTVDWYLDQVLKCDDFNMRGTTNSISGILVRTRRNISTDAWVDAIGYSWDPSYNVGDNLTPSRTTANVNWGDRIGLD